MKGAFGCLGSLLTVASVGLGAYTLIIIPMSNFASGSTGAQNAMILPNLVISVVMFVVGCALIVAGGGIGNNDGGSGYSSPSGSSSEPEQSAFGRYWTRLGNEAEARSNIERGIPTNQWSDGAKTTPQYDNQRFKGSF